MVASSARKFDSDEVVKKNTMSAIMKRAWQIYKQLEGDRVAKMALAMKQAWAELKKIIAKGENAYACEWSAVDVAKYVSSGFECLAKKEEENVVIEKKYAFYAKKVEGMTDSEKSRYRRLESRKLVEKFNNATTREEKFDIVTSEKALNAACKIARVAGGYTFLAALEVGRIEAERYANM